MSVSNIDVDSYENDNQLRNDARKAVSDAWKAKFEQAYQKAKLIFADDPKFTEIEKLHSNTNASINKAKWKTWKLVGIIWGILIVVLVIIFTLTFTLTSSAEKKEIQRLENIEIKIEAALEDGDYKLALMNADSLDFNGADSGLERDWEIKRNYWIDKVIEEASKMVLPSRDLLIKRKRAKTTQILQPKISSPFLLRVLSQILINIFK